MKNMAPHPRLLISAENYARLKAPDTAPHLLAARKQCAEVARAALADDAIHIKEGEHNWHLLRARQVQKRAISLLAEYKRTGERPFREKILDVVRQMSQWEYWSWIAWRDADARPDAIFDLSYGENAFTLSILFDALATELDPGETELFVQTARRWVFGPYLAVNSGGKKSWYYEKPDTNWNTVCNGGAAMLALAIAEHCPEAAQVLEVAQAGMEPFFRGMDADGAWPEGIGYWNYGMRYGLWFLLSHERATGQKHPLLALPSVTATLRFPLSFSPRSVPCSFGDVNKFWPLPFIYAAAERLGCWDVVRELDLRVASSAPEDTSWPDAAEMLLFHPRERIPPPAETSSAWPRHALMRGLDWGYVADRMPAPDFYVSVRGGTTKVPHAHVDLMSFNCLIQDEVLIANIGVDSYCDSSFGERRFELYETSYPSKNTILINGLGLEKDSTVRTEMVSGKAAEGFRIDATEAMGAAHRGTGPLFCGRLLLLLDKQALLVVDHVRLKFSGWVESRLHTFAKTTLDESGLRVALAGERRSAGIAIASTHELSLRTGLGMATSPESPLDTIIRMMPKQKVGRSTIAYLVGAQAGDLSIEESGDVIRLKGHAPKAFELTLDQALTLRA